MHPAVAELAANDRVKVRIDLARSRRTVREPSHPPASLDAECRAAGLDPVPINSLVRNAQSRTGRLAAPELTALREAIFADVASMVHAVEAGAPAEAKAAADRLAAIDAQLSAEPANEIAAAEIGKLIGVSEAGEDSLHRLVMDLHKALNRLAARCAEEIIAGAHAFGFTAEDRPAVEAFMRGLESTRAFEVRPSRARHRSQCGRAPGWRSRTTLAPPTPSPGAVEGDTVTITYTDVHRSRAILHRHVRSRQRRQIDGLEAQEGARARRQRRGFLFGHRALSERRGQRAATISSSAFGAALVFLIDWNKARKVLELVGFNKGDSYSHPRLGGARSRSATAAFCSSAAASWSPPPSSTPLSARIGFGERLDGALGRGGGGRFHQDRAARLAPRRCCRDGQGRRAHDEIEAELVRHLRGRARCWQW